MTKYLSQDVKSAIDNYKAPFTRIKVQLNPQQFGEMDLTVVQRGKNLHINLSSNNAAINTLAMNANDLKVQLQNTGINNASLNFNNNSQSQDGSASQQQHSHQNRRDANEEYNYFTSNDENEEVLSSLEIVVPYYA
jgi:flagellar hook-length control protein FliK